MAILKPGDLVRPITEVDGIDATDAMTPCRVMVVYKNGNVHVASEDGKVTHHGPASGFQKIRSNV